jgi:flagellar biosynthesis chaperone FliJ
MGAVVSKKVYVKQQEVYNENINNLRHQLDDNMKECVQMKEELNSSDKERYNFESKYKELLLNHQKIVDNYEKEINFRNNLIKNLHEKIENEKNKLVKENINNEVYQVINEIIFNVK